MKMNRKSLTLFLIALLTLSLISAVNVYAGDGATGTTTTITSTEIDTQDAEIDNLDILTALNISGNFYVNSLTSSRIPIIGADGLLTDDSDLTFSGDTLTVTKIAGTTFTGTINMDSNNINSVGNFRPGAILIDSDTFKLYANTNILRLQSTNSGASLTDRLTLNKGVDTATLTVTGATLQLDSNNKLQLRDSDLYIASLADGYLDIVADTAIRMSTTDFQNNGVTNVGAAGNDFGASNTLVATTFSGEITGNIATGFAINILRSVGDTSSTIGNIKFGAADGDANLASIQVVHDGAIDSAYIAFKTEATESGLAERMRIHSSGLVEVKSSNGLQLSGANAVLQLDSNNKLQLRDSDIYIYSSADGILVLEADSRVQTDATFRIVGSNALQFRDGDIYIQSNADGDMLLVADGTIQFQGEGGLLIYDDDGNSVLEIKSHTDDAFLRLNSGTDGTTEQSQLVFQDNDNSIWRLRKLSSNDLEIYDDINDVTVLTFDGSSMKLDNDNFIIDDTTTSSSVDSPRIYFRGNHWNDPTNNEIESQFYLDENSGEPRQVINVDDATFSAQTSAYFFGTKSIGSRIRFGDKNGAAAADDFYLDPTAGNGMEGFVYDYSNGRLYWYGNGGVHYASQDGGIWMGPDHQTDILTGEYWEEGDIFLFQVDTFATDGVAHGAPVSLSGAIEEELGMTLEDYIDLKVEERLGELGYNTTKTN